jgi:short-subunit dehydrogenase
MSRSARGGVVEVDLALPGAAAQLAEATVDLDLGLVVSNAGGGRPGAFLDRDLDDLHATVGLNAVAHLDIAHLFGRRLVDRGRGGLLLVSSMGGTFGLPYMAADSAASGLVLNLGEALQHELRGTGVDVSVMLPGAVDTPVIERFGLDRDSMPIRPTSVEVAVREALRALVRGRATHVPGRTIRTLHRLMPRRLAIRTNAQMLAAAAERLDDREREQAVGAAARDGRPPDGARSAQRARSVSGRA